MVVDPLDMMNGTWFLANPIFFTSVKIASSLLLSLSLEGTFESLRMLMVVDPLDEWDMVLRDKDRNQDERSFSFFTVIIPKVISFCESFIALATEDLRRKLLSLSLSPEPQSRSFLCFTVPVPIVLPMVLLGHDVRRKIPSPQPQTSNDLSRMFHSGGLHLYFLRVPCPRKFPLSPHA